MSLNSPVTGNQTAIVVSKAPLNLNDPLNFVRVSQSGCWTDDANGVPTKSIITYAGQPTILEWSKRGTELYFATNDNKLYRVSHITRLMDLSASSYNGKFNTDVFRYDNAISSSFLNPESPYRTTLIGEFNRQITSISVSADDKNLLLTLNGTTTFTSGTSAGVIMYNNSDARTSNTTNINWVNKDGGAGSPLQNSNTYCSLLLKNDNKQVYVGTDNGIVYTSDITAGTVNWVNANNNQLPNVQVFDIEQQMMDPWECYNSGEIYVATNGRGVWSNRSFFVPYTVGIEETVSAFTNENGLIIYPNPSNDKVNIVFNGRAGERAGISIYDINGREVHNDRFQVSADGENLYTFQAGSLNSGVYIISMTDGTGNARMTKLIVTK
jgi:hypothetical protein